MRRVGGLLALAAEEAERTIGKEQQPEARAAVELRDDSLPVVYVPWPKPSFQRERVERLGRQALLDVNVASRVQRLRGWPLDL